MLDLTKPVQTRNGLKARIICYNRVSSLPVVALVMNNDGQEALYAYSIDGSKYPEQQNPLDLINIPPEHRHADLIIQWAKNKTLPIQTTTINGVWIDCEPSPTWREDREYRIKPASN